MTSPVYLVPASTEAKRIRLNQLNAKTGNRVAQQLIDSKTGEIVERDQIVKGYEFDCDDVDPIYLDTPYYVYPDGEIAAEPVASAPPKRRRNS